MAEEEDIISTLPNAILCHILSFLETKQSVATSLLSKRWNPLWRSVTSMRFKTIIRNEISNLDFNDFVYSYLLYRDSALSINTFHLHVGYNDSVPRPIKCITKWVNYVLQRGVEYLYLDVEYLYLNSTLDSGPFISKSKYFKLPITIFTCKTLVVLELCCCKVEQQGFSSVLLPCLKTLHLTSIWLPGLRDFMLFLTGCPLLEYLSTQNVSVSGEKSLTCNEWKKSSFLTKLARAEIDCYNHYFPLKAVYNVRFLRVYFYQGYYHDDLIPTFHNLTDLELKCYDYSKEFLLDVLNNCPKLQRFTLEEMCIHEEEVCARKDDKVNWVFPDVVPQCLSLHLRTCNLSGFLGLHGELMLVRYILKNARVLQTMKIWNSGQPEIKRILSEFPRASATCELTCNQ